MIVCIQNVSTSILQEVETRVGEPVHPYADVEAIPEEIRKQTEIVIGFRRHLVEQLDTFPKLRWIHVLSAGVDSLPLLELENRGIVLTNSSDVHGTQMAEQILGVMIAFTRGLHHSTRMQTVSKWNHDYEMTELTGRHLLILGAGSIGQELARKARAFDMVVTGVRRRKGELANFDRLVGPEHLHSVLGEADFVVVLVPLTERTRHLIGERELELMQKHAVLVNYARGDVIDEQALIRALQSGTIRGAGLDVFHTEPLPPESPLWQLSNVIITPHNAGATPHYERRAFDIFVRNFQAYRRGEPMSHAVDYREGY